MVHVCALESACAATAAAAALLAGKAQVQGIVLLTTQLLPDTHSAALLALCRFAASATSALHVPAPAAYVLLTILASTSTDVQEMVWRSRPTC